MRWAASQSRAADTAQAADEAALGLQRRLSDSPDLVLAFFDGTHVANAELMTEALKQRLRPRCLIGASGGAVIGVDKEFEEGPALCLVGAQLPGVDLSPFILVSSSWAEALEDPLEFARHTPGLTGAELVVLFGDPFSLNVEGVLAAFNRHAAGVRVVGGMASAGLRPHSNVLLLNDWVAREGGVALALKGALRADVVVSQGCRPIGPALQVTKAEQNLILELDGQPALERAEQVLRSLTEREREQLRSGLYMGRPARGGASGRGDYLIRNLLGADRDKGVLAVADLVSTGERVRLHVRDAQTALEDMEMLLSPQVVDSRAAAALLFSCNGRGKQLFGEPHRDISILQEALGGAIPVAGMFCAGESGPVGDRNFLHGHTASIAVVRPKAAIVRDVG